ncbi:ABC transporter permease [Parasulfuritortus cantonensis]|uniref:ABC transporter permease n=1 Tax=Parasulfuritortus cantonensis TaxID=2528202 RepID=A0A4R1BIT1_9PROT|nr:ABC transporter permease [Parasulfuritortus cantonensis]TCJ17210.1 ABC transporter permease [Parasulfuritortus cantonensis]
MSDATPMPASAWRRRFLTPIARQRTAMVGLAILAVYVVGALLAPWIASHDPTAQDLMAALQGPSAQHWLGTDSFGQDLYSRLLYGARLALVIGFASVALGLVVGVAIGLAAGLIGGRTEWLLMRITDGLLAFPELILAMAFMAVLGLGTENLVYALALSFVGPFARMTRSDVLQVKSQPYIEAARLMGVPTAAVIWRHVLPNVVSPILVQGGMRVSIAILLESGLSFLGIGVVPPTPDWGLMIAEGRAFITMAPWISGVPGLALAILLVALNLVGDGLRDAFDPSTQRE